MDTKKPNDTKRPPNPPPPPPPTPAPSGPAAQPLAAGTPPPMTVPPPYLAGNVSVPAATVSNLLTLCQSALGANCPTSSIELQLTADAGNAGPIFVGAASNIAGALSATNYGYQLTATGPPRLYRASYPGGLGVIGEIQVFAAAASVLHVEIVT